MADDELTRKIEAIVFSAGREVDIEELKKLTQFTEAAIKDAIKELTKSYIENNNAFMIVEIKKGDSLAWKMTVREKYLPVVRKITPYMEFPKAIMETLAVVAWKQPVLQSDVINIRTNKAYEHIAELEKLGFLTKEKHGRSYLLKLSQKFYDYFDLRDDVDVRKLFKSIKDEDEKEQQLKVSEFKEESNPEENSKE